MKIALLLCVLATTSTCSAGSLRGSTNARSLRMSAWEQMEWFSGDTGDEDNNWGEITHKDCANVAHWLEYLRPHAGLSSLSKWNTPVMGTCKSTLRHGDSCNPGCRESLHVIGSTKLTCNDGEIVPADGKGGSFSCIGPCSRGALTASLPPFAELTTSGKDVCVDAKSGGQKSGTSCAAQCQAGYLPSSPPEVKCYNGQGTPSFTCCPAPKERKGKCDAINNAFNNAAWHKDGLDENVGFAPDGTFYSPVLEIGEDADEATALQAAAALRGAHIVVGEASVKRGECKVSELQGSPQDANGGRYAIKHSVLLCATGKDGDPVQVTSDLFQSKCIMDSSAKVPHKCEARALNSDVTFALGDGDDDNKDTLTLNVGLGVAGACNQGHRANPEGNSMFLCLNDAYAKVATVGLAYDNEDGGHFGVALNLLGTPGGHGYLSADPTQIKFAVPVPLLPGVGLSVSVGFPGFDDPAVNKAFGTAMGVLSNSATGPISGATHILRPGAGVMPTSGDEGVDKAIDIALDAAVIATTGPFGAIGVLFKHLLKGPTVEDQAANAAGTICAALFSKGKLEHNVGSLLQCVCAQTENFMHADHCQKLLVVMNTLTNGASPSVRWTKGPDTVPLEEKNKLWFYDGNSSMILTKPELGSLSIDYRSGKISPPPGYSFVLMDVTIINQNLAKLC